MRIDTRSIKIDSCHDCVYANGSWLRITETMMMIMIIIFMMMPPMDDDDDYNLDDDATDGMLHLRVAVNYTKSGQANEKPFWNCS